MIVCVPEVQLLAPVIAGLGLTSQPPLEDEERSFETDELIFKAGDPKVYLYRVLSGVVCVYDMNGDEPGWIEFAYPGDLIGLGFLKHHTRNARALETTRLACLRPETAADLVQGDPEAEAKLSDAIEREFAAHRDELSAQGAEAPVERVAALLLSLSRANVCEGRRADRITDFWQCGTLADMAGIDLDDLATILVELDRWGLIESTIPGGLVLKRIDKLEAIAVGGSSFPPANGGQARRISPPSLPQQQG